MRSPPIERARVVGREGRQAAGLECSLYSDHKPLKQKEKKEKSEERQLHSFPVRPPDSQPLHLGQVQSVTATCQHVLSNQELLGCLSQFPLVAMEAV